MTRIFRTAFRWLRPDNPKSKIQNRKWAGLFAIALTFAFAGAVAHAQQPGKIFRIGFLDSSTASGSAVLVDAFRQELMKLGWIEGRILPSSTAIQSKSRNATLSLWPTWFVLRSI
jgi:hypothetical protein